MFRMSQIEVIFEIKCNTTWSILVKACLGSPRSPKLDENDEVAYDERTGTPDLIE